jgi:hypothetical protein
VNKTGASSILTLMKFCAFAVTCLLAFAPSMVGQGSEPESEDLIVLSPFEVNTSEDVGYTAASALAAARMATGLVDPNAAARTPNVPITITKRAEALAVSFALTNLGDKQERRNAELYASVESLRATVAKTPGLRFEHREVRFASGNRSKLSIGRNGATSSYAAVIIFADLPPGTDVVKTVKLIRDTVQQAALQGQTKIIDGVVGLYLKNPAKYRREILDRIFEDIDALKKSLGSEFEVLPSGLNQPVRARICSETDVELWLDYSFSIRSIRDLTQPKK